MQFGAQGIGFLESPLLTRHGFAHGFFTRIGGVSKAPFDSLNCARNVGDDPEAVEENLRRVCATLGVSLPELRFVQQVHGDGMLRAERNSPQSSFERCEGDAIETSDAGLAVAVRTADCVPILLACPETPIVAAVHSGWRGTELDIAGKAARALRERGARRLLAAVGPHIELDSFEVSEEVAGKLLAVSTDPGIVQWRSPRPHVNLRRLVHVQLLAAGLAEEDIDHVRGCTVREVERYFSHRRDGAPGGRQLSVIRCPE